MEYKQQKTSSEEKFISNQKKYKEELEKLELKYNGKLKPSDIVREASRTTSPLHNWFDWNDDSASEKWRLHQARNLINRVKVTILFEGQQKEYKKYLNVTIEDDSNHKERVYVTTEQILSDNDLKVQILRRALNEVSYWKRTYEDYAELEDVFKGINRTEKKLKKKKII